ncbi:CUE domain-containing protein [Calidifontibacillus oryziterrae]|uniref:CUE domain-containing protein n=1 Tax=Calidifontibacillus oryziterrae TaxID=1191699 RepID=UPI0003167EB8|nr:CUE domain-containing protein [Calidifontibacillus oryziterrae]
MVKRKMIVGMLTAGLVFGAIGSVALANENPTKENIKQMFENGIPSFSEMLPFMKEMHPNWSEEELEEMYQACHGEGGMMQNPDSMPQQSKMVNNF